MSLNNLSYKITDQTLFNISSLERDIAILQENEISLKSRYRVASEALFDDLFGISNFLKLSLTLGDVKKISIGKKIPTKEAQLLLNIRQIFDFVKSNSGKESFTFNFHLIQHVIKLLQTDILEVWDIGRIRSGEDAVDRQFELENQSYEYSDISNLLADSVLWVEEEKEVHPIIKATVFMMFINTVSPFVGLNFVASLVFFRLILEKYNYGQQFIIPIFKILNSEEINFREKLNQTLNSENKSGLTEILNDISRELKSLISTYKDQYIKFEYFELKANNSTLDLNERQTKLLKLLQHKVTIKRREYIKLFKVASMTAYRDLNYLVEKKLLVPSGQGKATSYTLISKV